MSFNFVNDIRDYLLFLCFVVINNKSFMRSFDLWKFLCLVLKLYLIACTNINGHMLFSE